MATSKHLLALLHIVVIVSVVENNEVSAFIPNLNELRSLVRDYLIPQFQQGGLVLPGRQQFAVAILQPNTRFLLFRYNPSQNNDGESPVINPTIPLSPPNPNTYNNYLAARPSGGQHSEMQILGRLEQLYNAYTASHGGRAPQALLLYSFIVPCRRCTDAIASVLSRGVFNAIPTKVVAYTTNGGSTCSDCDVNYTENVLIRAGIEVTRVFSNEQLMEIANTLALSQDEAFNAFAQFKEGEAISNLDQFKEGEKINAFAQFKEDEDINNVLAQFKEG